MLNNFTIIYVGVCIICLIYLLKLELSKLLLCSSNNLCPLTVQKTSKEDTCGFSGSPSFFFQIIHALFPLYLSFGPSAVPRVGRSKVDALCFNLT